MHIRDLIWTWTLRTIRARYQQSVLGWLWAVVQPAAQVAIFTLVFTTIVPVDTGETPYVLFAYVALTPWLFLSTALTDMCGSIVDNLRLVTRIYFPREVLPVSAMLARLLDFGVASLLVVVLVLYFRVQVTADIFVLLPLVVMLQVALIVGVGLAVAAANTILRDVRSLLVLVLQLWFYASPIIYPVSAVPEAFRTLYALNPMVGIIEAHRAIWLGLPFERTWMLPSVTVSLAALALGFWFFKRVERVFSDIG